MQFIIRGAKAIGISTIDHIACYTGLGDHHSLFPDTKYFTDIEQIATKELLAKHYSRPRSKRPNFEKESIQNQYSIDLSSFFVDQDSVILYFNLFHKNFCSKFYCQFKSIF